MDDAESPPIEAALSDGTRVLVRAFRASDRSMLEEAWFDLSPQTIVQRFQRAVTHLTDAELAHLVDSVDQVNHLAWGAMDAEREPPRGLGIARCIRMADDPAQAELAIVVIDAVQGLGLGTLLTRSLARAAHAQGIERLVGYVQSDNTPAIRMIEACGGRVARKGWGTIEVHVPTDV
ncbi:MAG: GNAT family N-acetyltransferase [Planctomycetota bacterium]|nr:GNAT family N-acetyltransferase [Planctomycetota bacterium]